MGEGQHTSDPTEGKIGRVLERARKDRGFSLDEAERATKIRKRYLEGLERDDYTVLPDAVYARGFLKTYANFLGLDGDALSQELRARRKPRRERGLSYQAPRSEFERPIANPGGVSGEERRRVVSSSTVTTVVVAVLVLAVLVGALYFVGLNVRSSAAEDERPEQGGAQAGETPKEREMRPAGNAQPAGDEPEGLTVGVEVDGAPAWIRIQVDSQTVFEEVAEPGFSRTFEAERIVGIRAGDAGAVSVEVNGQDVGAMGEPGQVLDQSYTLKDAS